MMKNYLLLLSLTMAGIYVWNPVKGLSCYYCEMSAECAKFENYKDNKTTKYGKEGENIYGDCAVCYTSTVEAIGKVHRGCLSEKSAFLKKMRQHDDGSKPSEAKKATGKGALQRFLAREEPCMYAKHTNSGEVEKACICDKDDCNKLQNEPNKNPGCYHCLRRGESCDMLSASKSNTDSNNKSCVLCTYIFKGHGGGFLTGVRKFLKENALLNQLVPKSKEEDAASHFEILSGSLQRGCVPEVRLVAGAYPGSCTYVKKTNETICYCDKNDCNGTLDPKSAVLGAAISHAAHIVCVLMPVFAAWLITFETGISLTKI